MNDQEKKKKAVIILAAGVLFNLSIGVLYVWSLLKSVMITPLHEGGWGWTSTQAGLPYTLAIIFFSFGVLIGGRVQDKIGPRWVATTGGAFVGLGLILSGLIGNNFIGIAICFGVITGLGIGFGYCSVLPPALKWFHPSKKGLVGGFVLGGFGLASVHYAPITNSLLLNFGIQGTMLYLGMAVAIISTSIAQFIKNPPAGYSPPEPGNIKQLTAKNSASVDILWKDMLKTRRFYLIFIIFLLSSSMGLMIIGNITKIATIQAGVTNDALLAFFISFLAVINTCGRIIGGSFSDRIGRVNALFIVIVLQMLNMIGFFFYQNLAALIFGFIIVGFCYGTFLSVFPALTADQYGLKNYGLNYGIVYLAWGLSGVVAPVIADYFFDRSGNFETAYIICAVLMLATIIFNYFLKKDIQAVK